MSTLIKKARALATYVHKGQFRRDGVTPYITHPLAVAAAVSDEAKPVALLHDVLEDHPLQSVVELHTMFGDEITCAVLAITKMPGEPYEKYLRRVKRNKLAREVKVADIAHNLSCSPKLEKIPVYRKALAYLTRGL